MPAWTLRSDTHLMSNPTMISTATYSCLIKGLTADLTICAVQVAKRHSCEFTSKWQQVMKKECLQATKSRAQI